jgi:predicted phosphodiesterase
MRYLISAILSFSISTCVAQIDSVLHSVYLIGDSGKDTVPSLALQLMAFENFDDVASTTIFLGDNVYPQGNSIRKVNKKNKLSERILSSQFEIFSTYRGQFYVIPGNHDWKNGKIGGLKDVKDQQSLCDNWFLKTSIVQNATTGVYFKNVGMPGPIKQQIHPKINLVTLDSQWWLQGDLFHKVDKLKGKSRRETAEIAYFQLDSIVKESAKKDELLIIAAHHPIFTNGNHAHLRQPFRFLINNTPLQIFGIFGLNRLFRQDIGQPRYKKYRKRIAEIIKIHPNCVYVSGHEHAMEYFKKNGNHFIVSGASSKLEKLDRYIYPAKFMNDAQYGFFKLTLLSSGIVQLTAYGVEERGEYWKTNILQLKNPLLKDIKEPKP